MAKTVVKKGFGFFSLIFAFLFGVICAVGGAAFAAYYVVTQVKIKDAVNTISGGSINYSDVITEEYAEKTVFELLGSAQTLASKANDGTLSLNDLNAISPLVGSTLNNFATTLQNDFGITLTVEGENGLLSTPMNELSTFVSDTVNSIEVAPALEKLSPETDLTDPVLHSIFYNEETQQAKTMNELVGDLTADGGVMNVLGDVKLCELLDYDPSSPDVNTVMKALANVTLRELTGNKVMEDFALGTLLGVNNDSPTFLKAIQSFSLNDLSNATTINSLKISDLLGIEPVDGDNSLIQVLIRKDVTIGNIEEKINELTVKDIMGNDIYEEDGVTLKGHWKYLLTKDDVEQNYTVNDIDAMITNMETNVQNARISDLVTDKIISIDDVNDLTKTLTFWSAEENASKSMTVGEMTLHELIQAAMTFAKKAS